MLYVHYTKQLTDVRNHVNNKISHVYKSKVTSHGNITSYENACHVEIPRLV